MGRLGVNQPEVVRLPGYVKIKNEKDKAILIFQTPESKPEIYIAQVLIN